MKPNINNQSICWASQAQHQPTFINRFFHRKRIVNTLFIITVSLLSPSSFASSPNNPSVSKKTYDALIKAEIYNTEKKYLNALNLLKQLIPTLKSESYDKALALKLLSYTYIQTDQNQKAIAAFEKTISAQGLPDEQRIILRRQISSLYIEENSFNTALSHILEILKSPEASTPEDYIMCGYIYIQLENFREALPQIEQALEMARVQNKKPQISWLQMKSGVLYELKEYDRGADTVLQILAINPTKPKIYWKQLASFYSVAHKDNKPLAVVEIINKLGFTTDKKDYLYLASLFNHHRLPYYAASLLELSVNNKSLPEDETIIKKSADYWWSAREYEKAITTYERLPIEEKKYLDITKRISRSLVLQRDWQKALVWLERSLKYSEKRDKSLILYNIASCQINLDKKDSALSSLYKALDFDPDESLRQLIISEINNNLNN